MADKIIVAPLMPTRGHPHFKATNSLNRACLEAVKAGIQMFHVRHRVSSAIHENRNGMIADLVVDTVQAQQPFTKILFQDDDIEIPPDAIVKLVQADKPIVGALCTTRGNPPIPNARVFHEESGLWENILEYEVGLRDRPLPTAPLYGAIGTGLVLLDYEKVIQPMAMIYLDCLYERDVMGMPEAKAAEWAKKRREAFNHYPNAWWYRWLPPLDGVDENSEDIFFCWMAKRYLDIQTWVDSSIQPVHIGENGFSIPDFEARRREVIERAKHEGRYHPATKDSAATVTPRIFFAMKKAAVGDELDVPLVEQPQEETRTISVLMPTRGRAQMAMESCLQLWQKSANAASIQILLRLDEDDAESIDKFRLSPNVIVGPRHKYRGLFHYYNELAAKATGDWLVCWSDDAIMETQDWDEKIHQIGGGLRILKPHCASHPHLNLFPIVSRKLYELLGHISLQTHGDSWLQVIGRMNGIEYPVELTVKHLRDEGLDDQTKKESLATYAESSPEFFSRPVQENLRRYVKRVHKAVERIQKQNLKDKYAVAK